MRDGGWKKPSNSLYGDFCRPSQIKDRNEKSRVQSFNSKRLSEPKRKSQKYMEQLDSMRETFYPSK